MAANTPDELYFWGWETLADSPLFTVHMDAKSSRVSVHLNRAMGRDYCAWLTFKHSDWSDFHRLVEGLDLESGAHREQAAGFASIEGPSLWFRWARLGPRFRGDSGDVPRSTGDVSGHLHVRNLRYGANLTLSSRSCAVSH